MYVEVKKNIFLKVCKYFKLMLNIFKYWEKSKIRCICVVGYGIVVVIVLIFSKY